MFKKTASVLALSVQLGAYCYPEYCFTSPHNEEYCFDMIQHTLEKTGPLGTYEHPLILDSRKDNISKYHAAHSSLKITITEHKSKAITLDIKYDLQNSEHVDIGVGQEIVEHTRSFKMHGPKEVRMGWMSVDEWNERQKLMKEGKKCKSYFWCP